MADDADERLDSGAVVAVEIARSPVVAAEPKDLVVMVDSSAAVLTYLAEMIALVVAVASVPSGVLVDVAAACVSFEDAAEKVGWDVVHLISVARIEPVTVWTWRWPHSEVNNL